MSKHVEFSFDVGSPATDLAWTLLPRIAADTDAALVYRPLLLGGVFKATGNVGPITMAARGHWMMADLAGCGTRLIA